MKFLEISEDLKNRCSIVYFRALSKDEKKKIFLGFSQENDIEIKPEIMEKLIDLGDLRDAISILDSLIKELEKNKHPKSCGISFKEKCSKCVYINTNMREFPCSKCWYNPLGVVSKTDRGDYYQEGNAQYKEYRGR